MDNNFLDTMLLNLFTNHLRQKEYHVKNDVTLYSTLNVDLNISAIELKALIASFSTCIMEYCYINTHISTYFEIEKFTLEPYIINHIIRKINNQPVPVIEFFEIFKISFLKIIKFDTIIHNDFETQYFCCSNLA
ncbi:MAG: hypothetical protein A2015_15115 [Spirochaetes bacterium GWF1_31_7]|nr:MAG: hypothetical protein A2Y30_11540 [Spirochaetes bacterium GWE1_32_154]OHD51153.1 MAG: hypothetical protein A2Y29_01080 [Spirochaetes bacterium GWE2_31_10]OHD52072.1 MAG: hypothetical protein A2015_15115 [Spirochaetes bacterium GWF1_31_7]OHD80852.1 MAG: hypothetical protein A2355_15000 [Spirochaetes bacterium RIFOXYB1_FULL_32_8]HBD96469.1 hypothetical protein [Spirochaetia bacterium]